MTETLNMIAAICTIISLPVSIIGLCVSIYAASNIVKIRNSVSTNSHNRQRIKGNYNNQAVGDIHVEK